MPRYKRPAPVAEPTVAEAMASVAICYKRDKEREANYRWHKINNLREKRFTAEYIRRRLFYDQYSGHLYWRINYKDPVWSTEHAGTIPYDVDDTTYLKFELDGVQLMVHRVACIYMLGEWPKYVVDHENHDVIDNRWENIRPATFQENTRNKYSRSASGYKGVARKSKKYIATICVDSRPVHLGSFDQAVDAALAYDEAAERLFGAFALTNKKMGLFS